jgi:hypothetical protein
MAHDLTSIRNTLQYLASSNVPVEHKKVLTAVLEAALQDALQIHDDDWQAADLQAMSDMLQGRVAISWQHADELLFKLSTQLHRNADDVKKKAIASGFGASVDYWEAKKARASGHAG